MVQLTSKRLTPGYEDWGIAVNAIGELDNYGALDVWAKASSDALSPDAKSGGPCRHISPFFETRASAGTSEPKVNDGSGPVGGEKHIWRFWLRLLRLYEDENGTVASICASSRIPDEALVSIDKNLDRASDGDLSQSVKCLQRRIELRAAAATEKDHSPPQSPPPPDKKQKQNGKNLPPPSVSQPPLLQTVSALGVLQVGMEDGGSRL